MFYRLNDYFSMRGWKDLPWTIVDQNKKIVEVLNAKAFTDLLLCDGVTDKNSTELDEGSHALIQKYIERGYVSEVECAYPLREEQIYVFYDTRHIQSVMWSITGRCNFKCRHCYMDAPHGKLGEVSLSDALQIIDQMEACGIYHISLTGGEPLVHPHFWEIVDYLLKKGMIIDRIYTNGWLVSEKLLEQFEKRQMKPGFSMSFDGVGWHDWMRGVNGAENKTIEALKLCKKRGFDVDVETCLHKGNRKQIAENVDFLVSIGVEKIRLGSVTETDLWKKNSDGNFYSEQEYYDDIIEYIPYYYEHHVQADILAGGVIILYKDHPEKYMLPAEKMNGCPECMDHRLCQCAYNNCYITPDSRLLPCLPMTGSEYQEEFPFVFEQGLLSGLNKGYYLEYVNKRVKDLAAVNKECADCKHLLTCGGGCRANALLDGQFNLMGTDRSQCLLWKDGYVEKIRRAADLAIAGLHN